MLGVSLRPSATNPNRHAPPTLDRLARSLQRPCACSRSAPSYKYDPVFSGHAPDGPFIANPSSVFGVCDRGTSLTEFPDEIVWVPVERVGINASCYPHSDQEFLDVVRQSLGYRVVNPRSVGRAVSVAHPHGVIQNAKR